MDVGSQDGTENISLIETPKQSVWSALCAAVTRMWKSCCGSSVLVGRRRVRFEHVIAEGGFSFVWLVQDCKNNEPLALKRVRCAEGEALAEVRREVELLYSIAGPGLVPILGHKETRARGGAHIQVDILFPFYPHGSLRRSVTSIGPGERECWIAISDILNALGRLYAAEKPFIHGDIKPDNILVAGSRRYLLTDLGSTIPCNVDLTTRQDTQNLQDEAAIRCSMPYRAPELFHVPTPFRVTPAIDMWSLGCTMYALAFAASPFELQWREDDTPVVVDCSHSRVLSPVSWPRAHTFSRLYVDTITQLLNHDPSARPTHEEMQRLADAQRR